MNAIEFLKAWVRVSADTLRHHDSNTGISDEVRQCQDAAFKSGLSEDDLDTAAKGDIASYLQKIRERLNNTTSIIR